MNLKTKRRVYHDIRVYTHCGFCAIDQPIKPNSMPLGVNLKNKPMKNARIYIGLVLLGVSCRIPLGGGDNSLLKQVYRNQKSYYDKSISDQIDYKSIVNFGSKGRDELYRKNGIQVSRLQNSIILEGFNPGWGNYRGLLITNNISYAYRKSTTGNWHIELVNINSDDVKERVGITRNIIDKVSAWDTSYINDRKKQLGARVTDGFVFMATRVQYIDSHTTKIETIAFDEFVY
jgi:hypothetical protein